LVWKVFAPQHIIVAVALLDVDIALEGGKAVTQHQLHPNSDHYEGLAQWRGVGRSRDKVGKKPF
jgi:hypothetical protein